MGDYDRKPLEPPSVFLRLKSKGEMCRIRIASAPYRELKVWPMADREPPLKADIVGSFTPGQWMSVMSSPDFNVSEVFHFVVIDRADNAAKIFSTTGGVYGKIRQYATDPEWGDPRSYDLTITRTEQAGKYYEVTPSPNKSDLTIAELAKVDALNIIEKVPTAISAGDPQPDDFAAGVSPEPLPWDKPLPMHNSLATAPKPEPAAAPVVADTIIEDDGQPINLDDIPFKEATGTAEKGDGK